MTISIKKESSGYSAIVRATNSDEIVWQSKKPMSSSKLMEQLCNIGCHQVDVIDALSAADPQWQKVGGMG